VNGRYRVRVANKAREIQRTDLAELLVVDHPEGCTVLFDREGKPRTIGAPVPPALATDQSGSDATTRGTTGRKPTNTWTCASPVRRLPFRGAW
jgi:hypothetical protein